MAEDDLYERRHATVRAMQHDGSDSTARVIETWILAHGGRCEVFLSNSHEFEKDAAYIRLDSNRSANLVIPGSWVVRVREGIFYAVLDADFHILYEKV